MFQEVTHMTAQHNIKHHKLQLLSCLMAFILSTWNKAEHQNKFQKIKLCIVNGSLRLQVASQAAKKKIQMVQFQYFTSKRKL